ncbi:hypothetical protein [Helicobacter pylori]|uniref:hypothetical protein n=1 Tax=Helicobacter pylori TaxID=210 RepID=UPI001E308302|nr:hypothetical protein [Helicobacter pylori]
MIAVICGLVNSTTIGIIAAVIAPATIPANGPATPLVLEMIEETCDKNPAEDDSYIACVPAMLIPPS